MKKYTVYGWGDDYCPSFDTLEEAITERDAMMESDLEVWKDDHPHDDWKMTYTIVDQDGKEVVPPETVVWYTDSPLTPWTPETDA